MPSVFLISSFVNRWNLYEPDAASYQNDRNTSNKAIKRILYDPSEASGRSAALCGVWWKEIQLARQPDTIGRGSYAKQKKRKAASMRRSIYITRLYADLHK